MNKLYKHTKPFVLEDGTCLPKLEIAYSTFGTLRDDRSNVVWVCHALTANSDVADWWPHTVEEGRFLDPKRWFVVCANILGSCYGTTGPTSIDPRTGEAYYDRFPRVTVRDMVRVHQVLAEALGISHVHMLIGASIGGYQALTWATMCPDWADKYAFIATGMKTTPWIAGFNESQRMAMQTDPTWGERTPDAGKQGMCVARSMALLSYRGGKAYNLSQADTDAAKAEHDVFWHRVQSYQRYQGEKLRQRFNPYSYMRMCDAVDSHAIEPGAKVTAPTLIVAISSDLLFPPDEFDDMRQRFPNHSFHTIDSPFGHDGFLVEADLLNTLLLTFMQ